MVRAGGPQIRWSGRRTGGSCTSGGSEAIAMICSSRVRLSRGSRWNRSRRARGSQRGWSSKLSNQSIFGTRFQSILALSVLPRLYFVRHGESEANRLKVFSNRDVAHGLTETGRAQVERLAAALTHVALAAFL